MFSIDLSFHISLHQLLAQLQISTHPQIIFFISPLDHKSSLDFYIITDRHQTFIWPLITTIFLLRHHQNSSRILRIIGSPLGYYYCQIFSNQPRMQEAFYLHLLRIVYREQALIMIFSTQNWSTEA
ncbi:hypothetical protein KFK09_002496 [Dendrobium nobile]|uniref:Uncharacterized protein n=1 Tax=Dendrobium nobile TaxID=94219 RepID=A0A8T3C7E0_DENNO|nr:hypothetical protein KFK09_002496 [Dendrobium nobile]